MEQPIDHFRWGAVPGSATGTFKQRYFVYDKFWKPEGPVFFYIGNEADVGLYVNHTGLMWESAEEFNALLVFAEHRYWGKSCLFPEQPCGDCRALVDKAQSIIEVNHYEDPTYKVVSDAL